MYKNKKRRPDIYPGDIKIMIAREYFSSDLGYGMLGKKYGYKTAVVRSFVSWYKLHFSVENHQALHPIVAGNSSTNNQDLTQQLHAANLKITALEMMLENASKELGIDVVKKFGTKQQNK
jgi:hypothetical protein